MTNNIIKSQKGKINGVFTKEGKKYNRIYDFSRYSNIQLVNILYSKKWNYNRSSYIITVEEVLKNRISSGKCTQSDIDLLKHVVKDKKHDIIKSNISNIRTTTTCTTISPNDINIRINQLIDKIYIITGVKLKKLNRTKNTLDKAHVFKDQIYASLTCIHNMLLSVGNTTYSRFNMLTADPQSGKTGVMRNVIFLLETNDKLREFLGLDFGSSLLITSMSDNANKYQLKIDIAHGESRQDNKKLLMRDGILHNPDLISCIQKNKNLNLKNCIIFIDESHLATNINSAMNSFLQHNGINLNGVTNLSRKNIYIFTVSATPYEEQVGNMIYKTKNTIELTHGPDYKGLKYFFVNNLLRQSFNLTTEEGSERFKNELHKFNNKIGYYIIRISRNTNTNNLIPDGFSSLTYYEKDKEVLNDILCITPEVPTIVFIKEKMKQSYQLDKSNIVMLFDRTSNYDLNRTNFIVQSFIGRACGYHKYKFIIYTDINNVKSHLNYMNNKKKVPISKNIKKDKDYYFLNTEKTHSSYSEYNNSDCLNKFPKEIVYNIYFKGYVLFNKNIIRIHLDKDKNLVLSKNSKLNIEYIKGYVENYVVHTNIKKHCNNFGDIKKILNYYCNLISSKITIDDIKTKNGKKFIYLLEQLF